MLLSQTITSSVSCKKTKETVEHVLQIITLLGRHSAGVKLRLHDDKRSLPRQHEDRLQVQDEERQQL